MLDDREIALVEWARSALKRIVEDNPDASKEECRELFHAACRADPRIVEGVIIDSFQVAARELGVLPALH